ncbi:MAG: iron ABC transporter permease [Deltaproteobacteria bacterium]|nr:iron ABC transporter permease [Deltaproteobacteria bacterium]
MTELSKKFAQRINNFTSQIRLRLSQSQWTNPGPLAVILFLCVLASLFYGSYPVTASRTLGILINLLLPSGWLDSSALDLKEIAVITIIRPPRILVAVFSGVALGMSGTALQGMMRNPLVGPDLVGVSSGAAFGSVLGFWLGLFEKPVIILAMASIGGCCALLLTMALAKMVGGKSDGLPLILAGFFVGAFFLACVGLLLYVNNPFYPRGQRTYNIIYWLLGMFRGADSAKALVVTLTTLIGGVVLMGLRWRINLLSLGDLDAKSLGIDVSWLRWLLIITVSFMVAGQVSVSGVVAWVGLIIPHCARMLVGPDHRRLMPTSALLGGLFVLGLDNFTRTVIKGEIPVGVLSGFIGTPLICFLFWKTKTKGWNES